MVLEHAGHLCGGQHVLWDFREPLVFLCVVPKVQAVELAHLVGATPPHVYAHVHASRADQGGVQQLGVVGRHDEDASVVASDAVQVVQERAERECR